MKEVAFFLFSVRLLFLDHSEGRMSGSPSNFFLFFSFFLFFVR